MLRLLLPALLAAGTAWAHDVAPTASAISRTPVMPVIRAAPDFALNDFDDRQVRLSALRGQPVLVAFVYTGCTTACPLLSARMASLQRRLKQAKVEATLLSVTVDPQNDDARTLAAFARRFGAGPGWHFLREAPARLAPVLAAYEEWAERLPNGELDHPARLHLVDAAGRVREIYSLAFFDEAQAFHDIVTLHKEEGN
jgi:cytochrome oxidase Cu insertion factor (SCO1/SenC/PrrC family)